MKKYKILLEQLNEAIKDYPVGSSGYETLQKTISMIKERVELYEEGYLEEQAERESAMFDLNGNER